MKALIFISSNILIIWAIFRLFNFNGKKIIGISISQRDASVLIVFEFILLALCYIDFKSISSSDIANDFAWNCLIIYYRGVLPLAGFMSLFDFEIKNPLLMGIFMLIGVIIFDYLLLRIFTFIKFKLNTKKS